MFSWSERMYSHIGIETRSRLKKGSSEESWTMSESLIQQYFMGGSRLSREPLTMKTIMTIFVVILVPAKTVPAAAVIQWEQVLFYLIGCKGCVGCY